LSKTDKTNKMTNNEPDKGNPNPPSGNIRMGGSAGALTLLSGIVVLLLIWLLARPLAFIILASALAAAFAPVAHALEQRMRRAFAVILIYLGVGLVIALIFWVIIPTVVDQVRLAIELAPQMADQVENFYSNMGREDEFSMVEFLVSQAAVISAALIALPVTLAAFLFEFFIIIFLSLYLLLEAPAIRHVFLSVFPMRLQPRADYVALEMTHAMGGFVRGQLLTAAIVGLLTYIGLLVIGVNFPLVLALLAAMLEVIPNFGPIIAAVPMVLIALIDSPGKALAVVIYITILQQVESHIILPNAMRTQTKISPLLVVIAVIIGATIGGLLGVLTAIPLAAALKVFFQEVGVPTIRGWMGADESGTVVAELHEDPNLNPNAALEEK
jgi:predicted PurR-regulated permease PerM